MNVTLSSFAAVVKTDGDKTVVVATLEVLEDVIKSMKDLSFSMREETLESLMVAIQDTLDNNVNLFEVPDIAATSQILYML